MMKGNGICNLGFGELLQGIFDGRKFLFNFPVEAYSFAHIRQITEYEKLEVIPEIRSSQFTKSIEAAYRALDSYSIRGRFTLDIDRIHPTGCGLSASTADVIATVRACGNMMKISDLSKPTVINNLIGSIEPNDGLHFPGISHHQHVESKNIFSYAPLREHFRILALTENKNRSVNTVEFNKSNIYSEAQKYSRRYKYLASELHHALQAEDYELIFHISSQSAQLWQKIFPKDNLDKALRFLRRTKGLGIINTHSGNMLGLVYMEKNINLPDLAELFMNEFDQAPLMMRSANANVGSSIFDHQIQNDTYK